MKNFFGCCLAILIALSCGSAQAIQPERFSDVFATQLQAGIVIDPIYLSSGIRLYEGLGYSSNLTFTTKKSVIFPAGIIFSAGYSSNVEGSNDPLAKVVSLGVGWTSGNDPNMPQIEIGAERLDLHEFGDALKFNFVGSMPILNALDTYYASVIFRAEGIAPTSTNGDKYLNGANAGVALRLEATADQHLSLVQEFGARADDGSNGRPPAGLLSYSICGEINAGSWNFIFPRVTLLYANENGGDDHEGDDYEGDGLRRDEEMATVDFVASYNF